VSEEQPMPERRVMQDESTLIPERPSIMTVNRPNLLEVIKEKCFTRLN
jgi:hypothetical protein